MCVKVDSLTQKYKSFQIKYKYKIYYSCIKCFLFYTWIICRSNWRKLNFLIVFIELKKLIRNLVLHTFCILQLFIKLFAIKCYNFKIYIILSDIWILYTKDFRMASFSFLNLQIILQKKLVLKEKRY